MTTKQIEELIKKDSSNKNLKLALRNNSTDDYNGQMDLSDFMKID